MWILTLLCNSLIMTLLWILSASATAPAYNHLVLYPETETALPLLTDLAFKMLSYGNLIPIIWAVVTILWGLRLRKTPKGQRAESLALHTAATLCFGFAQLVFFYTAKTLPLLKIGIPLN